MPQEEEGFSANNVEEPSEQTPLIQTNSEITESPKWQNVFSSGNVPITICACLCVLFMNLGLLSLFYLVPLGYAVLVYKQPGKVFFTAAVVNLVFSIIANIIIESPVSVWIEILYTTTLFLCFTWIMGGKNMRTVYRFVIASAAASFAFLVFVLREADLIFYKMLAGAAEMLSTAFPSSVFTTESIVEISKAILLRGGAAASMFFLFFVNRRLAVSFSRLIKKQEKERELLKFFAPSGLFWVFLVSAAFIALSNMMNIQILQIIAWNIFVISAIIFLAKGAGIILHLLENRAPAFRVFVNVLVIVLIFSPLNTLLLAAVVLLGVLESRLPLRRLKQVSS